MTERTEQMTARIEQWLRRRLGTSDKYRPERHYMRGPGPKSMAKSGATISDPAKAIPKESKA